jgi:hypothetical protein
LWPRLKFSFPQTFEYPDSEKRILDVLVYTEELLGDGLQPQNNLT